MALERACLLYMDVVKHVDQHIVMWSCLVSNKFIVGFMYKNLSSLNDHFQRSPEYLHFTTCINGVSYQGLLFTIFMEINTISNCDPLKPIIDHLKQRNR